MSARGDSVVQPARWHCGPPAPHYVPWLSRALSLALLVVVGHWVQAYLGGVAASPTATVPGANDTGKLFNWHPVLMVLGFGVFMSEAVQAYQAPLIPWLTRPARKRLHWILHTLALTCIVLALVAAYQSHALKLPVPIPNYYSPHSFLGIVTVSLLLLQFVSAMASYVYPQASLSTRMALGPVHKFAGRATWALGLATMATGLQEKTTFLQMGKALTGDALYGPIIQLPAVAMVLLALLALCVLYQQVPAAGPPSSAEDKLARQALLGGDVGVADA